MNKQKLTELNRLAFSALLIFLCAFSSTAQVQPEWDASLGGNIWEELNSVEQTNDGGFIMAGFTSSSQDSDVGGVNNGGGDYWVVKTDNLGQIEWENNFGGNQLERPWKVLSTSDGGYMVAGYSPSNISGDKTENSRGADDYWVVKMDNVGNYEWDRTYGGDNLDFCYDMIELNDGGFLLGGRSLSGISGEKTEANNGNWDYWLVKIDAAGNFLWDKTIGGNQEDLLTEMQLAPDGDVLIAGGTTSSMSGDVTSMSQGNKDFWLVKVSSANGDLIWQRRYGGGEEDEIFSFVQTADGGFLLGGGSRSDANPPYKSEDNFGVVDMWIVKTGPLGAVQWDRTFGGDGLDNCYSVRQNSIGYYIISGFSESSMSGNKTTGTNGGYDFWMLYLNESGDKQWETSLGGAQNDVLENAFQIDDGGYLLAGHSSSDVSGDKMDPSNGNNDFWIIKTLCDVELELSDTTVCPNEPVTIDLFNGTNCVDCIWNWSDDNTDSIRTIITDVTTTYNITLTDGVGCSQEGEITISVLPTSINLDLEESLTLCNGDNETLNAGNAGNTFNWSTGASTQIINVSTSDTYIVTVSDANDCAFVDSTVVNVLDVIAVDLGSDTTICSNGGSITLDAGNPGLSYLWSPGGQTTQTITVSTAGTYSVVAGDQASNCFDTDEITISVYNSPTVMTSMVACNDTNTFYTVTLEIEGGDVDSYTIDGANGGSFNGNVFTSNPIPKDQPYTFFLSDGAGCTAIPSGGIYGCDCTSDGGLLDNTPIIICGDEVAEVEILAPSVLDNNDILRYALHESIPFDGNDIVYFTVSPFFNFQTGMNYGQTYFITALSGNELTPGEVLLEDGCLGVSNSVPITFNLNPEAIIESQSSLEVSCSNPILILDGGASLSPDGAMISYNWAAANGGNIPGVQNDTTAEIVAAGTYYLTVTNTGGCSSVDSVAIISNGDLPNIVIEMPVPLSCRDTIVTIDASASDNGPDYEISWIGDDITNANTLTPSVITPGVYALTITNTNNGCSATQLATVLANYDTPVANVDPIYYMDCTTRMVSMEAFAFPPEPEYLLRWNTEDGEILSGAEDWIAVGGAEGVYTVEIIDSLSGCSDTTATTILPNQFEPTSAWLKWTFPICLGDSNGTMRVDSIQSGTAPFEYSFNGEPFTVDTFNNQLSAGENNIEIKDFFGCTWDTTVVFRDGRELLVDLEEVYGPVELGDSIQLIAVGSEDTNLAVWESPEPLSCADCLNPWILPTADSLTVKVQLYTEDGCTNRDSIQIEVVKFRKVFIPNVFTPNGNRKNEFFSVFNSKEVKNINYLKVYNRWGGVIYEDRDLALNDKKNGWDGTHKNGRAAMPGVYIFVVEIEFLDGFVQQYRGDFTLYK